MILLLYKVIANIFCLFYKYVLSLFFLFRKTEWLIIYYKW